MKKVLISSIVLFITVISVSAQKTAKAPAKPVAKTTTPVMKNLLDSFSYAAGFNVATNMKAQGISKVNTVLMQKGIDDVFKNNKPVLTAEVGNQCMQSQLAIFAAEKSEVEKAKGIAFLETNKKRKEVTTLPSGLQYEVIKNGDANTAKPKLADTVVVNFSGSLIDGTEFENSFKKGQPTAFPVASMIKGWIEILQLMRVGDHWKVYIPSELAFGAAGTGGPIPPNATLIFEIAMEGIRPAVDKPKN